MSEELYIPPANALDPAAVDAEFANIFGLDPEELGPAIVEGVGRLAVDANLTDVTYADRMNAQAAAAGIAPLTAENIEDELIDLQVAFFVNEMLAAEERSRLMDDDEDDKFSKRKKKKKDINGPTHHADEDDLALAR